MAIKEKLIRKHPPIGKNEIDSRSLHSLGGEGLDFTDSSGGSLLEGDAIQALAHVDRVVSGDNISLRLSLSLFGHCKRSVLIKDLK